MVAWGINKNLNLCEDLWKVEKAHTQSILHVNRSTGTAPSCGFRRSFAHERGAQGRLLLLTVALACEAISILDCVSLMSVASKAGVVIYSSTCM